MKSTSAALSGGQIRLTSDPVFQQVINDACEILADQAGGFVSVAALTEPALHYVAEFSAYELEMKAGEIDLSKGAFSGAVRLTDPARITLDRLCARNSFARPRKDTRSTGVWSRRAMLVVALYAYAQHVVAANG